MGFRLAMILLYPHSALMSAQIRRKLFTAEECYRMAEVGILLPEDRVELIRGDILKMSPIGPRHGAAVDGTTRAMVQLLSPIQNLSRTRIGRYGNSAAATPSRLNCCRSAGST